MIDVTCVFESEQVDVPAWAGNLESFRRWADSKDFPETGRIWYWKGKVWVDMSREQFFSHGQIKRLYAAHVGNLVEDEDSGYFCPDGTFLSHPATDLCVRPDGMFVSYQSLELGHARLVEGSEGGYTELEGTPDMVLEIVSRSSVKKDTVVLTQAYWEAGIKEYWLVDARKSPLRFIIHRYARRGYVVVRPKDGWVKSTVFGKSFRLSAETDKLGNPKFKLEVR